ncbi:MAG: motility protein A [Candidatus Marinimicrobia bacterium]|jgi:chemotaxis protein MotA|nr:motility protein A [Candidatus Neomarinimicrobiota bacterium]MBT3575683.1 motility protein A [Candidatus Neomarinimicrobiota bacterium]MBT3678948.1 motility protein A [Candidatus Neomarinimicrobiota bacterium]MBT3952230.1 motility protein A [Candidatus Neomarinimicrobiota bacterium]MBT4251971.1 motility protein A [Candidatus Neomarinimicrobiota bacterium]
MDFATIIGFLLGLGLIGYAIIEVSLDLPHGAMSFVDLKSLMIVLGGTIAATAVAFPVKEVLSLYTNLGAVFKGDKHKDSETLKELVELAAVARKGTSDLEKATDGVRNFFLKDGVQLIVDGHSEEDIRNIMETRVVNRQLREDAQANVFKTMGSLSPAFGMVGTLVGLVAMLLGMGASDTEADQMAAQLGSSMGVALITTFYGALFANMIFIPIAAKLRSQIEKRNITQNMIIDGIIMLKIKKHPMLVREFLNSYLSPRDWVRED